MTNLLGTGVSISLDSIGCFRADLAKACGVLSASMRRWHGDQVHAGRLKEGRDFVVVRQSPHECHHDDDVFYFYEAIKICQKRMAKNQIDLNIIQLNTLRSQGFQIIDGQVVRRNQLKLFEEIKQSSEEDSEENHCELFLMLVPRQYNGVTILQRSTDSYIRIDKLCEAVGENWHRFEDQLNDPNTKLGIRAQMLSSNPSSYRMPLVQKLEFGVWADPQIARFVAEEIDIVLANLVEQWEFDLRKRSRALMTNSQIVVSDPHKLLEEAIKRVEQQSANNYERLLRELSSLKEDFKTQRVFDLWNQKIQQCTSGAISTPLQYWEVFKQKPTKATRTRFPFIYVIIVYAQHIQRPPEIFYVGKSSQQPYERFSNHNGLRSVEALVKYGYTYEIRYIELQRFQLNGVINTTEIALQAALEPYWEHLTTEQRSKIKCGELINSELFARLFTRDELTIAS